MSIGASSHRNHALMKLASLAIFVACVAETVPETLETKFGFTIGDRVTWMSSDADTPPGEVGIIVGFGTERVNARFEKGTWSFEPNELVKEKKRDDGVVLLPKVSQPTEGSVENPEKADDNEVEQPVEPDDHIAPDKACQSFELTGASGMHAKTVNGDYTLQPTLHEGRHQWKKDNSNVFLAYVSQFGTWNIMSEEWKNKGKGGGRAHSITNKAPTPFDVTSWKVGTGKSWQVQGLSLFCKVANDETDESESSVELEQEQTVRDLAPKPPMEHRPYIIKLNRESVPVKRQGKVVSFKTTYSGMLRVGSPAQAFRVVFDTGSGHVVLPSSRCTTAVCKVHKQYELGESITGVPINTDKNEVKRGEPTDQVTIGYGTGKVTGGFVHERICLGSGNATEDGDQLPNGAESPCADVGFVSAVEMSPNPFGLFPFDGICGLGLPALALDPDFSIFNVLSKSRNLPVPHFGVFLTEGEEGEVSELSLGGHNPARLAGPIKWAKVPMADKGYWQVSILAVHIGDHTLDVCKDGSCRGIVDTGTSHIGIPSSHNQLVEDMLTRDAGDLMDCRIADSPEIKIELEGFNLTLGPENYMRRLPLRDDVSVSTGGGVTHPNYTDNATDNHSHQAPKSAQAEQSVAVTGSQLDAPSKVSRWCRPRTMPVKLPPPLGPNLFLLGEPLLQRYYTVFDWQTPSIGFGTALNKRYLEGLAGVRGPDGKGMLPKDVDVYLMQQKAVLHKEEEDEIIMFQIDVVVCEPGGFAGFGDDANDDEFLAPSTFAGFGDDVADSQFLALA